MSAAKYTGTLKRGDAPNTIVGTIKDAWNWEIHLTGTRQADGTYTLIGVLGETPPALLIPLVDNAPAPVAPPRRERVPAVRPYAAVDENGRVVARD